MQFKEFFDTWCNYLYCIYLVYSGSGPEKIFETVILNEKFSLGSFGLELNSTTFGLFLFMVYLSISKLCIDQNYTKIPTNRIR